KIRNSKFLLLRLGIMSQCPDVSRQIYPPNHIFSTPADLKQIIFHNMSQALIKHLLSSRNL
ncbi:hypothetical protein L9F63_011441, partial [Diploptera punctata]